MNTLDLFRLDGKTAIITGGGRGLGQYFAEALSDAGANVVLCSRTLADCEEVQHSIEARGGQALALACDVTQQDEAAQVVEAAQQRFGAIDILINNSGATWGAPPEEMPLDKFDHVINVNIRGTFIMSQLVGRTMITRGQGGKIINIASILGLIGGNPHYLQAAGYHASKGAIVNMTRDLATSWAHHGITVNAIAPGWFPTRMSQGLIKQHEKDLLTNVPLARFGKPEDLKGVVVFLASPAANYMTGQTIAIDGGITAW